MKKVICLIFVILTFFVFSACGNYDPRPSPSAPQTVVKVTVTYHSTQNSLQREYVSSEKMRAILNYLRWIDPYGKPTIDPDTTRGSLFRIALQLSDGTQTVYLQKADQFMQINDGPWLTIDPERAGTLSQIVEKMESDELTRSPSVPAGPSEAPPHPQQQATALPPAP